MNDMDARERIVDSPVSSSLRFMPLMVALDPGSKWQEDAVWQNTNAKHVSSVIWIHIGISSGAFVPKDSARTGPI